MNKRLVKNGDKVTVVIYTTPSLDSLSVFIEKKHFTVRKSGTKTFMLGSSCYYQSGIGVPVDGVFHNVHHIVVPVGESADEYVSVAQKSIHAHSLKVKKSAQAIISAMDGIVGKLDDMPVTESHYE